MEIRLMDQVKGKILCYILSSVLQIRIRGKNYAKVDRLK